jgi:hypothetical protein
MLPKIKAISSTLSLRALKVRPTLFGAVIATLPGC